MEFHILGCGVQVVKKKCMKIGILIIGSLLWDLNKGRKDWRRKRLVIKDRLHVIVPIRYGRLSGKNGEKRYTMVFSRDCLERENMGTAYVVPCRNQNIRSFIGIENQAKYLSKAEGNSDEKLCEGENKWCTIGILFNPEFNQDKQTKILQWWKTLLKDDGGLEDYKEYKVGYEESILSEMGEIRIRWIYTVDESNQKMMNEFDFILATCTKPGNENESYPTIDMLLEKVLRDSRKYFFKNIKNGITTFQDRDILKLKPAQNNL